MDNEPLTITIPFQYYEKLKKYEFAIENIKKDHPYLAITKIESKCGFSEIYDVANFDKINGVIVSNYKAALKHNDELFAENLKLKYEKTSIWQLLKKKLSL